MREFISGLKSGTRFRFTKNFFFLSAGFFVTHLAGLGVLLYAARKLTIGGFGVLSFAVSLINVLQNIVLLGTSGVAIRDVAKDRQILSQYIGNITTIKVFTSFIAFGILAVFSWTSGIFCPTCIKFWTVVIYALVFFVFIIDFQWVFISLEKMEWNFVISLVLSLSYVSLAVLFVAFSPSPIGVVSANVIGQFLASLTGIYLIKRLFSGVKFNFNFQNIGVIVKSGIILALIAFLANCLIEMGSLMINLMLGNEANANYNAALRPVIILIRMQFVFLLSLFPILSSRSASKGNSFFKAISESSGVAIFLSVAFVLFLNVFSKEIITLLFTSRYLGSFYLLQAGAWLLPFFIISGIYSYSLIAANEEKLSLFAYVAAVIVNIILNLYAIPKFGAEGVIISAMISLILLVLLLSWFLSKKVDGKVMSITAGFIFLVIFIYLIYFSALSLYTAFISGIMSFTLLSLIFLWSGKRKLHVRNKL